MAGMGKLAARSRVPIRLEIERRRLGWSQEELARRSGVHRTTISWIEGRRFLPSSQVLQKLCKALRLDPAHAHRLEEEVAIEPLTPKP